MRYLASKVPKIKYASTSLFPITFLNLFLSYFIIRDFFVYFTLPNILLEKGYLTYKLALYTPQFAMSILLFYIHFVIKNKIFNKKSIKTEFILSFLLVTIISLFTHLTTAYICTKLPYYKQISYESAQSHMLECQNQNNSQKTRLRRCYRAGLYYQIANKFEESIKFLKLSCVKNVNSNKACTAYALALVTYPNIKCSPKLALELIQAEKEMLIKQSQLMSSYFINTYSLILAANGQFDQAKRLLDNVLINQIDNETGDKIRKRALKKYQTNAKFLALNRTFRQFHNISCKTQMN